MHSHSVITLLLPLIPLVSAHGKVSVATGDAGGNGTALGIQGGIIPGAGPNRVTEPDTTVFRGQNADGCGRTKGQGENDIQSGTAAAMALSGTTLPQVSPGGSLSGTVHIVTSDGAGPYKAMINTDGTAASWTPIDVVTQVPGRNGNIRKGQEEKRWWWARRALQSVGGRGTGTGGTGGIAKRATNINEDFPFKVAIPAGTQCTGTIAGQSNACIVKLVNPSAAGPFGGCVPVQMASSSSSGSGSGNGTAAEDGAESASKNAAGSASGSAAKSGSKSSSQSASDSASTSAAGSASESASSDDDSASADDSADDNDGDDNAGTEDRRALKFVA